MLTNLRQSANISMRSASGGNLYPIGLVTSTFCLGKESFTYNFIVYKNLGRMFIRGLDFLHEHNIGVQLSDKEKEY